MPEWTWTEGRARDYQESVNEEIGYGTKEKKRRARGSRGSGRRASPARSLETPRFVKDISVLITPATVRGDSPLTERMQAMSLKYDRLVKEFSKTKSEETLNEI